MTQHNPVSRRAFGGSLLAVGALAASRAVAAPMVTAESPMGPFYPTGYSGDDDLDMTMLKGRPARALGDVIEVSGRVLDRQGDPMRGAKIELWQANANGRYAHSNDISAGALDPNFQGLARLVTGPSGEWRIRTIRPNLYGRRTRHIHFDVSGRAHRLMAQMYFPEDAEKNASDGLYRLLGKSAETSLARLEAPNRYRWDIVLMDAGQ
ncbi:MAG TPA: protocatechuate 3,4-dioxygenase [Sphingorhabdus sp.]|jgi:protocatechuate 3,4-dioxygenase beta subunit|nr:protocatechuate 3,4-dioxygenase [Sphingorhabdus sp.]